MQPSACRDVTEIARHIISPHHYLATIAGVNGIGNDSRIRANVSSERILLNPLALIIATDQHSAATRIATHVHDCSVEKANVIAKNLHRAARCAATFASSRNCSRTGDCGREQFIVTAVENHGSSTRITAGIHGCTAKFHCASDEFDLSAFLSRCAIGCINFSRDLNGPAFAALERDVGTSDLPTLRDGDAVDVASGKEDLRRFDGAGIFYAGAGEHFGPRGHFGSSCEDVAILLADINLSPREH